ncbi:MAG: hypothetical protein AAB368_07080, partial [bacterium]
MTLTVTNNGAADVAGVTASVTTYVGGALVELPAGPVPAAPVTITAGGGVQVFSWTFSVSGAGTIGLMGAVGGTVVGTGRLASASAAAAVTAIKPAVLTGALSVAPFPAAKGQWITVTLLVTNTGDQNALVVTPTLDLNAGPAVYELGPVPASAGVLAAGGGSQAFVWTYSVSGAGLLEFTATAAGTDATTGKPVAGVAAISTPVFLGACAIPAAGRSIERWAGDGNPTFGGDGSAALLAQLNVPAGVAADASGNLYVADLFNSVVRRVDAGTGIISTLAGIPFGAGYSGDGGPALAANLNYPSDVAVDGAGNLYIADPLGNAVRKVDSSGVISTFAGDGIGSAGYAGDSGPAFGALLSNPTSVAVDGAGNVYIADTYNNVIRKVDAGGIITTVNAPGLFQPCGVAVDAAGNLIIADTYNNLVRRYDPIGDALTTIAGDGTPGYGGDGGPALAAQLNFPCGVDVDGGGNVFVADAGNAVIRKVDAFSGEISAVAGTGAPGYGGDGGQSGQATLGLMPPTAFLWFDATISPAFDLADNLLIPDFGNSMVRTVRPLSAAVAVSATCPGVGEWVEVTLTIMNSGTVGAQVTGATVYFSAGEALLVAQGGPVPAVPLTLGACEAVTFAWTFSVSGAGTVSLASSATILEPSTGRSYARSGNLQFLTSAGLRWSPGGLWHPVPDAGLAFPIPVASSDDYVWWYGRNATGNYDTGGANTGDLVSTTAFVSEGDVFSFWS